MNREEIKINDLCISICSGGTPKSSEPLYYEGGTIPWLTTSEVNFKDIYSTLNKITELGYKKSSATIIPINSIIVAMYGVTAGRVAVNKIELTTNQACCNLIIDEKKANYRYVYYYLMMQSKELNKLANGGAQQNLNSIIIKKYKILIPKKIEIQNRISNLLYNYDKLIENNNRRIKLLETMAEELYKEWFVRFRFPGYKNIKYKSSNLGKIPLDFKVVKIKKVIEYYIGGGWGSDNKTQEFSIGAYVVRGADFPYVKVGNTSTCPYRYHKKLNYEVRQLKKNDIVLEISGGTSEQPVGRAIIVTEGVVEQLQKEFICASFCKLIRAKKDIISPMYLYYWLQYLYDTKIIEKFQLQSTGIINFKFEYFYNKCDVLLPPNELMKKFDDYIIPIKDEIDKLSYKNRLLTEMRDYLLPRLMSGKLLVENKNII